ncbi:MAG: phosphate acyltransferase, partial [Pseudomonadota bacterium]
MSVMDDIIARSRKAHPHIVLSEGDDARVLEAVERAEADGIARITLIGGPGIGGVSVIDPVAAENTDAYADVFAERRKHKGVTAATARAVMTSRLGYAAMMVREGDADGTLGGAVETTSDVVRTALQVIGKSPDVDVVSSCFLMLLGAPHNRPVIFSDCGLVLQPKAPELASIAESSIHSLSALTGLDPRVAFLSFSTKGSVPSRAHESLERVHVAMAAFQKSHPDIPCDGEVQFDAAIVPSVAERKTPGSPLQGAANVFVFPDLNAG